MTTTSEFARGDVRRESKDPNVFADYLLTLNDPVERVRQALNWFSSNNKNHTEAPQITSILINNTWGLLDRYDDLVTKHEGSNS